MSSVVGPDPDTRPIVSLRGIRKEFGSGPQATVALSDISLDVERGETLALVGESGSGKSTLARIIVGLEAPSAGEVLFEGKPLNTASHAWRRDFARRTQLVFQSSSFSLNPLKTVAAAVAAPLRVQGIGRAECRERVRKLLEMVELKPYESFAGRYPRQLSGGQRQRVVIARAMALRPALLVADEPVSALDVSVRNQVLNLMLDLKEQFDFTLVLITHDLGVARGMANRIAIMRGGGMVEIGRAAEVLERPSQAYTRDLLEAVPLLAAARHVASGDHCPSLPSDPAGSKRDG